MDNERPQLIDYILIQARKTNSITTASKTFQISFKLQNEENIAVQSLQILCILYYKRKKWTKLLMNRKCINIPHVH